MGAQGKSGKGGAAKPGRTRVSGARLRGEISEWRGFSGWISPISEIDHPDASKNGGRIYVHKDDVKPGFTPAKKVAVEFVLYQDARGLGAESVGKAPSTPAPRGSAAVATPGTDLPLPAGWAKHWSEEHEEYYYWHKATKASSWTHPSQDEGDVLPLGWTKEFDPASGDYYYWHKSSRTAQWDRPQGSAATNEATDDAAALAKAAKAPVLGLQRREGIVTNWQDFFGWISPLANLGKDLKPLLDKDGKVYVNWRDVRDGCKLKVGSHVSFSLYADDTGVGATDVCLHSDDDKATGAAAEAMDELEQKWAEQEGEAAEKAAANEPAYGLAEVSAAGGGTLLPGWEEMWSEEHGCPYYWHQASQQSSWERPAVPDDGEDTPADGRPPQKVRGGADAAKSHAATPLTPLISKPGRCMTPITPTVTKGSNAGRFASRPIPAWQPPAKRARAK